ncbi:hypothetical protein MJ1_0198 [Nanobdella aerobiophila]|uniref:Uncharacterized protein n=1 Tax=Nanobdella aerobiophila TaxID=2586965 RepID=A0A915WRL7_9ARCH|nr:hypothetical protein [Nanobdella aerobiophila]BBL45369.1 hypothetical protein MJ1_0198 [Nanobdella aerobiophila]
MIKEVLYLSILFLVGYFVLSYFFNFYNISGKFIANQFLNQTNNINYQSPVSYVIYDYNINNQSLLYLVQSGMDGCIKNVYVGNQEVNFSYNLSNSYTYQLYVDYPVDVGDNITITFCNGQSNLYTISNG